jgi:hypothetical protein
MPRRYVDKMTTARLPRHKFRLTVQWLGGRVTGEPPGICSQGPLTGHFGQEWRDNGHCDAGIAEIWNH